MINWCNYLSTTEINPLFAFDPLGEINYSAVSGELSCLRYSPFGVKPDSDERAVLLGKSIAD